MPNFLETILAQLKRADGRVVLREIRGDRLLSVTGRELLDQIQLVRMFIRSSASSPGNVAPFFRPIPFAGRLSIWRSWPRESSLCRSIRGRRLLNSPA